MVQYTLAEFPEVLINVSGKDSAKSRQKAMDQLVEMLDNESLPSNLPDGFGPDQFIEVKELPTTTTTTAQEDDVTEAIQLLSNLANLKLKTQELRQDALSTRKLVDLLFSDDPITEAQISEIKEGFKVLKNFAQMNIRYREARAQAETARTVLDAALQDHNSSHR
jgi:hypothetical protein